MTHSQKWLLPLVNDKFRDIQYSCYGMACGRCRKTIGDGDLKRHVRTCHKESITCAEAEGIRQLFNKRAASLRQNRIWLKSAIAEYKKEGRKCLDCGDYFPSNKSFDTHLAGGCGNESEPVPLGVSICGRLMVCLPFPEVQVDSEQIEAKFREGLKTVGRRLCWTPLKTLLRTLLAAKPHDTLPKLSPPRLVSMTGKLFC